MPKHKSEDYKISAVEYYLNSNDTQEEVCRIFNCSVRSLMRWVEKYETNGTIKRYDRKIVSYKVTKEHVNFIMNEIKKDKTITMEDLLIKLKEKFDDLDLSRRHLSQIVKDNYISLKLTRYRHEPIKRFGKDININQKLKEFYKEVKKYKLDDIICIDESSISALQKRNFCYEKVGKRCIIKTQSQEVFKKYTAIFVINSNGVIGWKLYEKGGIDSNRLYEFLEEYITKKYKNKLIILDNASSHRNEKIKNLINQNNKILYSVPYQHYTNAIEGYFNVLKSKLRKMEGHKYDEIKNNITNIINKIPKIVYYNLFKGSYKRDKYYIKKTSIPKKVKFYKK